MNAFFKVFQWVGKLWVFLDDPSEVLVEIGFFIAKVCLKIMQFLIVFILQLL